MKITALGFEQLEPLPFIGRIPKLFRPLCKRKEVVEMGLQIAAKIDSYEDRRETQTALIKNKKTIEDVENYDFTL